MDKEQIIEYLYENNVRGDLTIEQMAEDLADRKTEPKQEWIPCSERLPSDGQCVIIQYFDTVGKNHISVVGAYYNERQGFVDTGYGEMWFGNGNDDVLAWMPLPKPWKGTDDEID